MYHFILTSYSLYTQVMPSLILINVQYLQNVVFSFENFLNSQNHSSSDSHQLIKHSRSSKISHSPLVGDSTLPLNPNWKALLYQTFTVITFSPYHQIYFAFLCNNVNFHHVTCRYYNGRT